MKLLIAILLLFSFTASANDKICKECLTIPKLKEKRVIHAIIANTAAMGIAHYYANNGTLEQYRRAQIVGIGVMAVSSVYVITDNKTYNFTIRIKF